MRNFIAAGALGLMLSASLPVQAAVSDQDVADLKQQVQALLARVQQLESQNSQAAAGAAAAVPVQIGQLETRVAQIESTQDRQTDQLAQTVARDRSMDWAGKVKLKGDLRYRHEMIDEESRAQRDRQRIRARFGLDAKVNDKVSAGFQIATGAPDDPRSTNATLTDSNQRKGIQLDQAYIDWNAFQDTTVTAGKQKYPWYRPGGSLLYDSDVNPEGVAIKWGGNSGLFANAWGLWLSEVSSGPDATIVGAQLGWATDFGLKVAVLYHDFGSVQGHALSFADYPAGNSTYSGDSSCHVPAPPTGARSCYVNDYNLLGASAEYSIKIGALPLSVWIDYVENQEASHLNTGYDVGVKLGKAGDPGTWELGLLYQDTEKDAQWGGFIDSDFAGGATQGNGIQVKGGWAPARNVAVNLAWFDNTRNYDTTSERDYQRLQLDFSIKF